VTEDNFLLWFDDELDEDTKAAVARARSYFKGKYGRFPRKVIRHFPKHHYLLGPIPKRLTPEPDCGIM